MFPLPVLLPPCSATCAGMRSRGPRRRHGDQQPALTRGISHAGLETAAQEGFPALARRRAPQQGSGYLDRRYYPQRSPSPRIGFIPWALLLHHTGSLRSSIVRLPPRSRQVSGWIACLLTSADQCESS